MFRNTSLTAAISRITAAAIAASALALPQAAHAAKYEAKYEVPKAEQVSDNKVETPNVTQSAPTAPVATAPATNVTPAPAPKKTVAPATTFIPRKLPYIGSWGGGTTLSFGGVTVSFGR